METTNSVSFLAAIGSFIAAIYAIFKAHFSQDKKIALIGLENERLRLEIDRLRAEIDKNDVNTGEKVARTDYIDCRSERKANEERLADQVSRLIETINNLKIELLNEIHNLDKKIK